MDHEKISAIRESLLNDEDAPRAWAQLAGLTSWTRLSIDEEGLLLKAEVAEILVPPGPQLVWLKGLKDLGGRLNALLEVELAPDLQPFFDADELLLYLRGDQPTYHYEVLLDVDGLGGRYGECLLTEQDCKALVRSIVAARGSRGLADWIHDHLDVPMGSGDGPLSGSYDLKFHHPPPEWFDCNVFGCAGEGEPELGDLVEYEPSSFYVGLGEISRGHLGRLKLRLSMGQTFAIEDLTEVTWSGWFEAKEHPGTPVNQFRLPGAGVTYEAEEAPVEGRSWKIYAVDEVGVLEPILDPSSGLRDFVQVVS